MSFWQRIRPLHVCISLALTLLVFGCTRQPPRGRLLASADGNELRMSDVASHVDTASAYAVRNYVSHWVDQQLLFGEAHKLGLDDSPKFNERVKEFSTQLAITMLLNRMIYDVPVELSPDGISDFYQSHLKEFVAAENIAYVNYAAFDKRTLAVSFRNALVSGSQWSSIFSDIPPYAIMDVKDSVYLTSANSNSAIWNVIQSLESGRVSFPIQVDSLSYIVQVIDKIGPGEQLPMRYAMASIRERLSIQKRQKMYAALVDSLRNLGNFQIDPSVAIRDTSSQE